MTKRFRAIWNDAVLADSTDAVVVGGNAYFPVADLRTQYLRRGASHTTGPWKGIAIYYDIVVDDQVNQDGARFYPNPTPSAERVRGRVAFWGGVKIEADGE